MTAKDMNAFARALASEEASLNKRVTTLSKRKEALEDKREHLTQISQVLYGLCRSVFMDDPGKYETAYHFLRKNGNHCYANPFLPQDTVFFDTHEEWQAAVNEVIAADTSMHYWHSGMVVQKNKFLDPNLLATPDQLSCAPCPVCHEDRVVIERYEQTEDGPDGDTWRKELLVLCCGSVQSIETQYQDSRF